MELTHASFFSGVGGLDLGLERAGWRTVSFSEIEPYASAVLAERWPGIANLGDVTRLVGHGGLRKDGGDGGQPRDGGNGSFGSATERDAAGLECQPRDATLWTGGFPCQDLSVAGKRRGLAGARSGLAFAFLDLVADVRPPAVLLENVPGLLSSHGGRDLGTLLGRLGQLGYGWAYRVLDARYFGVPQRRRRVFICALDAGRGLGAVSAAEVLSVGHRCARHPATGHQAGPGAAERAAPGVDIARAVTGTSGKRHDDDTDTLVAAAIRGNPYGDHIGAESHLVSASPDASGMRAAPGLAGRLDHSQQLAGQEAALDATYQASAAALLRRVWPNADEEALQRSARGLRGIPAAEVLRLAVHGEQLRQAAERGSQPEGEDGQLPRAEAGPVWALYALREARGERRSPPERGSQRQPTREPDAALSGLPSPYPHLAPTLRVGPAKAADGGPGDTVPIIAASLRASDGHHGGVPFLAGTIGGRRGPGPEEADSGRLIAMSLRAQGNSSHAEDHETYAVGAAGMTDDPLLPLGLDSHRYRCAGNGVVAPVAEYIGMRLRAVLESA